MDVRYAPESGHSARISPTGRQRPKADVRLLASFAPIRLSHQDFEEYAGAPHVQNSDRLLIHCRILYGGYADDVRG